tara:strand:- start:2875 stop:3528 length:654 start_codon:yes stop_codon:yes gene_type:complete
MADDFPSIDVLISDAIALGYSVYAMIIDEDNNARYVSNSQANVVSFDNDKWKKALENIHGGPISSIEEILEEEKRHRKNNQNNEGYSEIDELDDPEEIENWIQHYKNELFDIETGDSNVDDGFQSESYVAYLKQLIIDLEDKLETFNSHDTWFDPANPDAIADAPCYCGWLGLDQPPAELAPPNCSCVSNIEPNHGFDLGHVKFEEKKQEEENNGMG